MRAGSSCHACAVLLSTLMTDARAQQESDPVSPRVAKLLSQLTIEEEISLLHGSGENAATSQGEAGYLAGVPRLGIFVRCIRNNIDVGIRYALPLLLPKSAWISDGRGKVF